MKINYKVAIALVAGAFIGGAVVQGLHAEASPPAYVVAEIDVTNADGYAKEYLPVVRKLLLDGGAKFLAAGTKIVALDGEPPKSRVAIVAFENVEKARAAYTSAAFMDARKIGDKYAKFRTYIIEGVPPK